MFCRKELLLVTLLATTSLAAVAGVRSRQADTSSSFKLYAYGGEQIGGYEIFYADGLAYVGDSSALVDAAEVTTVNLTASSQGVWTATALGNASWTSKNFYVSNTTGEIGFADSTNSSSEITTSGFRFYDNNALLSVSDNIEASWHVKETEVDKVWSLGWGLVDEDSSLTPISLRSAAPVTEPADATT